MKKILLDTNFFLVPFQLGVNIMTELERIMQEPFELMTLKPINDELESLAKKGRGDDKVCAQLGLQLARSITVEEVAKTEKTDDSILLYATQRKDVIVATNDSALRKKLKVQKVRTIFVRNRSTLDTE
jgi:hypothetical protein